MEVSLGAHDNNVGTRGNDKELVVDVVGNTVSDEGEERVVDRESQDATECSSSFGCTDSGSRNAEVSGDMEVESQLHDDSAMLTGLDGCSDLFRTRKKKLTDEWRKFVHPLMWRCKWVELKVRELRSQVAKYDRELEECDKRKHCELEKFSTEDHAIKSAPFINHDRLIKLMKRRKRKRVEDAVDLASYTAGHSLFAHFVSKKSGPDTAHVDDDNCHAGRTTLGGGEFDLDSELPSLQFKDSDAFESILRKIEEAQVHVRQLRMRMDKVVRENAEKFPTDCPSFPPHDQSTSSDPNSVTAPLGCMPTTSQRPPKMLALPETVVSVDMIKSIDDPLIGGRRVKIENEILSSKQPVKEESNTAEDVQNQPLPETEGKPEVDIHVADTNLRNKPTPKTQSLSKMTFPKNKKQRGRRKARTGRWSKRSSG
ncbi:hypothetical protein RND81_03G195300 [Saponaria officinalis]